jgi:hypothetical protein
MYGGAHNAPIVFNKGARYQRAHRHDPRPSSLAVALAKGKSAWNENGVVVSPPRAPCKIEFQQRAPTSRSQRLIIHSGVTWDTLPCTRRRARTHTGATRRWIGKCCRLQPGKRATTARVCGQRKPKSLSLSLMSTKLLICLWGIVLFRRAPA